MDHVLRRLFTIASAVSLMVSIAAAALWVRSYFNQDILFISTGADRPMLGIAAGSGTFTLLLHERYQWPAGIRLCPYSSANPIVEMRKSVGDTYLHRGSFGFLRSHQWRSWAVACPCWFIVLATASWPLTLAISRRRKKAAPFASIGRGYDLRASTPAVPSAESVGL